MKTYKIWTYIEECDEDKGTYKDVADPLSIGEFKSLKEADKFREDLFITRPTLD